MKKKKVVIIGSGFSGLSTAAYLAKSGMNVTIIEKNKEIGGRSRVIQEKGYTFDMGPSWYWMPDIFEEFFKEFDIPEQDMYSLIKLDPGFKMIFESEEIEINADFKEICKTFEKYEKGGSKKLKKFIDDAEIKYNVGIKFLNKSPGVSILEFFNKDILLNLSHLDLLKSYKQCVRNNFSNPYLINILEFPVLFLGASASNMPALYSLMTYSALKQGTFYPMKGFHQVINSMQTVCTNLDVKFVTNEAVEKINIYNRKVDSILTDKNRTIDADIIVASADYAHVEEKLINKEYRNYSKTYWQKKKFSPSSLIFYLGINKKIKKLIHHNLFFDEDVDQHMDETYKKEIWPKKPLFYVCCPSKTDNTVAPKGKENIFILIPIAAGVTDSEEVREKYFNLIIKRIENYCKQSIKDNIEYKKSYCVKDFKNDYNAYKGNAYGLANTLSQTANLKPKIYNKHIKNMFYTGQLTVPGPGVPPALISGKIVSDFIKKKNL